VLHSNKSQSQRDIALARFKGGKARVLVATDVASRGLDIEGIGLVVNYDAPRDPDDYVHRVGRTARAKREGRAVTLITLDEFKYVKKIEQLIKQRISRRNQPLPRIESDPNMPSPDRERGMRPGRPLRGEVEPRVTRSERKVRNEQMGISPPGASRQPGAARQGYAPRQTSASPPGAAPRSEAGSAAVRPPASGGNPRYQRGGRGRGGGGGAAGPGSHASASSAHSATTGRSDRSARGGDAGVSAALGQSPDYGYSD
jgi:ATP-dependent RNA helicase RhlE